MGSSNIQTIDTSNFQQEVLKSATPVLVDFWAEWCGPCKMLVPVLEELAGEYEGRIRFGKVDVEQNQQLAGQYNIMQIPTLLLFKGGEVVAQMVGLASKKDFKVKLDQALA